VSEQNNYGKKTLTISSASLAKKNTATPFIITIDSNPYHQVTYFFFIMCCMYTTSFLPYGRFFNQIGGN